MVQSESTSGTLPSTIMRARPSAMAVLPTPASPTYSGLFLRRRHRISMVRSTSSVRPISGSILPSCASWLRFDGVLVERAAAVTVPLGLAAGLFLGGLLLGDLRETMRDEIDHVETGDLRAIQQVHGMALLLAEDGDEHVGHADFLLAATTARGTRPAAARAGSPAWAAPRGPRHWAGAAWCGRGGR